MVALTKESAKKFVFEEFAKMKPSVEKKFLVQHTKGVVKTALKLAKNKKVDKKSLEIACWLHDVARSIQSENHAQLGVKMVKDKFGKINSIIEDCIVNHGSSKDPQTEEGKIIQVADKLSIMNDFKLFEIIFAKEKYQDESFKMLDYVYKDLIEVLKRYKW